MTISELSVILGGILSLLMVIFHIRFHKLFNWQSDFEKISSRNQKIFYTIHIALLLLFLIFSIISFVYVDELSQCDGLAFGILLLYSLFWLWRIIWQIIYFKPRKSKNVKSSLTWHYFLILWFMLLFVLYFIPVTLKITQ